MARSPSLAELLRSGLPMARRAALLVGAVSLFLNVLLLVSPLYMMQVFDRVLTSGHGETLVYLTLVAFLALLVLGILEAVRAAMLARIGCWIDRELSGALVGSSLAAHLHGRPLGAQPLRDLAALRGFLSSAAIHPLFDCPWIPVFIAILWIIHPWLGWLGLASAALLFGLALLSEAATRGPLRRAGELQAVAHREVEGLARTAEIIQAMGLGDNVLDRWRTRNDGVLAAQQTAGTRAGILLGVTKFTRLFVQIAVLGAGGWLVLQGQMTGGGMIAASILLGRALAPVEQAIGAWRSFLSARSAAQRLRELARATPAPTPTMQLPTPTGRLSVEGVTHVPAGAGRPVLHGVSFGLAPGQSLGILGPSAGGKSTLCRLLVGVLPPTKGQVRLDGAEVHSWHRPDFGRHVGYLPQEVELFAGTVRENIARLGAATDEEVIAAATLAGLHELILRLPDGYHTAIGPAGLVLSGGQRQRIGLARAVFGSPRLVVLDEPNASLDQEGIAALVSALAQLRQRGTTVVVVSHQPNLLGQTDRLLVLRDGQVDRFGPTAEVLAQLTAPRPGEAGRPRVIARTAQPAHGG